MPQKSGLGRGLGALIPGGENAQAENGVLLVQVEMISPNPRQPRTSAHPQELGELEQLFTDIEQSRLERNLARYRQLNRCFHQVIYRASRHPYLTRTLDQMWVAFPTMMLAGFAETVTTPVPDRAASDRQEHKAILAALKSRAAGKAEKIVRSHIEESVRHIAAALSDKRRK